MDNVYAWRLGVAANRARPGGDPIDHGWSLLRFLDEAGFDVVPREDYLVSYNYPKGMSLNEMARMPRLPRDEAKKIR